MLALLNHRLNYPSMTIINNLSGEKQDFLYYFSYGRYPCAFL